MRTDDLILLKDEQLPRGEWKMGRIINTYPDDKGIVRAVDVRTQGSILKRPITKIVTLLPVEEQ